MPRRLIPSVAASRVGKEDEALLAAQEQPILSDDALDSSSHQSSHHLKKKQAGGRWRSRLLFGGGGGNNNKHSSNHSRARSRSRSQGRAPIAPSHATAIAETNNNELTPSRLRRARKSRFHTPTMSGTAPGGAGPTPNVNNTHRSTNSAPDLVPASSSSSETADAEPSQKGRIEQGLTAPRTPERKRRGVGDDDDEEIPMIQASPSTQKFRKSIMKTPSHSAPPMLPPAAAGANATAGVTGNNPAFQTSSTSKDSRILQVLKRPFGRDSIPDSELTWFVRISPAEWDADTSQWQYRMGIQKKVTAGQEEMLQDWTHGMTTSRSLQDFAWLETCLQSEWQGSLLLPSLQIALGIPGELISCQQEVDSEALGNWFSDVLNGWRGQGEWCVSSNHNHNHNSSTGHDWQECEAMEAFLYRADLPHHSESLNSSSPNFRRLHPRADIQWDDEQVGGLSSASSQGNFFHRIVNGELCGLPNVCVPQEDADSRVLAPPRHRKMHLPLDKQQVSSKALGDARTLNVQDSFVDNTPHYYQSRTTSLQNQNQRQELEDQQNHLQLLQAERDLIWNYRCRALQVVEKLRIVENEEKNIASAWKRFAIAASNLFAFEKEVESARLGDPSKYKSLQMPYRKLQKSTVEDVLRIMAKAKVERCTPTLDLLSAMLNAYVADVSSVTPAVDAYLEALRQVSLQAEKVDILKKAKDAEPGNNSSLKEQIQAGLDQVKKQLVVTNPVGGAADETGAAALQYHQARLQLQTMEQRLQENEHLLRKHLTKFCKSLPVRTARMAYALVYTEAKQAGATYTAAAHTRSKISLASKETLSKMIVRHGNEIKEDRATELQLVQRMVNLGTLKKYSKTEDGGEEIERGIEISKDVASRHAELRDRAMDMCRSRIGRWDSKVAMAVMEAVGVEDANVRVEETTRELRLVRKYAIGMREHVQRCVEALELLKMAITQGPTGDIRDLRTAFMSEAKILFSGVFEPTDPEQQVDERILSEHGIRLDDPLGWRRFKELCGGAANSYLNLRDSGTEWLLGSIGELLKEYFQRVESVESFVYMECVGIQLEKHFSQKRAAALAAFEKKTDITSAINIATRKRMPALVTELQAKLEAVGASVSHTTVKEAKEAHLESKALKQELHDLSMRQLTRARETSTERTIALMTLWSKEEESGASSDLQALKDFAQTLERSITPDLLKAYQEVFPGTL